MEEKWIVMNNTGKILNLPKNGILLKSKNEVVDLISLTGKSVIDLERDQEIRIALSHNDLITLEKVNPYEKKEDKEEKNSEISKKLDDLISVVKGLNLSPEKTVEIIREVGTSSSDKDSKKYMDEEKMRLAAIEDIVNKSKNKKVKNFGEERRKEGDIDDFSDIIDF